MEWGENDRKLKDLSDETKKGRDKDGRYGKEMSKVRMDERRKGRNNDGIDERRKGRNKDAINQRRKGLNGCEKERKVLLEIAP